MPRRIVCEVCGRTVPTRKHLDRHKKVFCDPKPEPVDEFITIMVATTGEKA